MNYPLRNSAKKSNVKYKFIILLLLIFFIVLFMLPVGRTVIRSIFLPVANLSSNVSKGLTIFLNIYRSKKNLIEENILLKSNQSLVLKDIELLKVYRDENTELKELLGKRNISTNILLAAVIKRPSFSPYDVLVIDAGSDKGVSLSDQVLVDSNVIIGEITEVNKYYSNVRLYSSPGTKTLVLIGGSSIEKEAIGIGGGNFKVEVPKDLDINIGDPVIIPSVTTNIFGLIEKIDEKSADPFQTLMFKSPVNMQEIRFVEVILKNE